MDVALPDELVRKGIRYLVTLEEKLIKERLPRREKTVTLTNARVTVVAQLVQALRYL
jgi:hypothetical protein